MEIKNNKTRKISKKTLLTIIGVLLVVIAIMAIALFKKDVPQYSIMFDSKGGSWVEPITVESNEKITKPADPQKEGAVFSGWYLNGELYDFNEPIAGDIKLEAKWDVWLKVEQIELNKSSLTLTEGESAKLTATIKPSDATDKNIVWKSSDTSVVTVDSNGNIKAVGVGNATITVTSKDGGYSATTKITVIEANQDSPIKENIKVTGVVLNKSSLTLTKGESAKLTATIKPSNASNKNVTWKSSDTSVVTVDAKGNIKAVGVGSATITAITKDGGYKATATITVNEKPASYVITFTEIKQEVTGSVLEYSMKVTKNGSLFVDFKGIKYNNTIVKETLAATDCNKSIKTATIVLSDGSQVTNATVVYK